MLWWNMQKMWRPYAKMSILQRNRKKDVCRLLIKGGGIIVCDNNTNILNTLLIWDRIWILYQDALFLGKFPVEFYRFFYWDLFLTLK